ncbi:MAG: hypothetical protein HN578_06595 [Rhodospirillales bacterium]|jgi:hypothetical protein|nr:hypothetical protein [Rhodospirillales bacterium]MBT8002568.1 hypothetical protein [Rhodospirillales bacterium]
MAEAKKKECFVIGPIGAEGSDTRNHADWLFTEIILPVASGEFGYNVERADKIAEPGRITDQIINEILEADLVIADLSERNPNAFYELGIRHMMPNGVTIHMVREGEELPFDIQDYRAIVFSLTHPDHLQTARTSLAEQIRNVQAEGYKPTNPITDASGIQQLRDSADDKDNLIANLSSRLDTLTSEVDLMKRYNNRMALLDGIGADPSSGGLASLMGNPRSLATLPREAINSSPVRKRGGLLQPPPPVESSALEGLLGNTILTEGAEEAPDDETK